LRAALWKDSKLIDLGIRGQAFDINNKGEVIGEMIVPGSDYRAFRWHDGVVSDLGTIAGVRSTAYSINEAGVITGISNYTDSVTEQSRYHAVLWKDGSIRDLGTLGGNQSYGMSINDKGEVIGASLTVASSYHVFVASP
jgi:probable HAF family extracellular repeat protein